MWFERFVIIVVSLSRDFLPSSWHWYFPSYVEVLTLMGRFGLFFDAVPAVLPVSADGGDGGSEVGFAAGESAHMWTRRAERESRVSSR